MKLKKICHGYERIRGTGFVFITDGKDIERFDNCCFNAERGDIYNGSDSHLGPSLMLAFDEDEVDFVVKCVEMILAEIKAGSRRNRILRAPRRADADPED